MIHLRPPFVAVYVRAAGPDGRPLDEQVRLTHAYVHSELASGRWAGAAVCYYLDPLPGNDEKVCWGLERLMDDAHTGSLVAVVCDRFDRLDGSPTLAAHVIAFLEGEGVHLVFLDEGVDAARLTKEPLARLARVIVDASPPAGPEATSGSGKGLRVATYARVASASAGAHTAIDSQLRLAEAFVAAQRGSSGWAVQSHVSYRDLGTSGKDRDRPGLQQLERDLAAGQIDVVLCASLDRIARNVNDLLELLELFQTHGVRFIALRDDIGVPINPSIPSAVVEALSRARSFAGPRPSA